MRIGFVYLNLIYCVEIERGFRVLKARGVHCIVVAIVLMGWLHARYHELIELFFPLAGLLYCHVHIHIPCISGICG